VAGEVERAGIIDYPIAHDTRDRRKMRALVGNSANRAKIKTWPATTRYRRLATARQTSLVELEMFTGVTHQLRVHLAAIGYPIIGDKLYGANARQDFGLGRHFLHAQRLRLCHPQHGREIEIEAALPVELTAALNKLKMRP
jgi:23S rRNA-/tRNA-specific pseudouridylate synthase